MSSSYDKFNDDDGRVVADMSELERTPMLIPRFENVRRSRRDIGSDNAGSDDTYGQSGSQQPVYLDREERKAMIGGAVSAALLVGGIIAVAFAALIFVILHVWG